MVKAITGTGAEIRNMMFGPAPTSAERATNSLRNTLRRHRNVYAAAVAVPQANFSREMATTARAIRRDVLALIMAQIEE